MVSTMNIKRSILAVMAIILLVTVAASGCSKAGENGSLSGTEDKVDLNATVTKYGFYFDTEMTITLYGTEDGSLIDGCFEIADEMEKKISRTIETSEISEINSANGESVTVSDDTAELIRQGIYYGDVSNGLFDITIGKLSVLWDIDNNEGVIPDDADIKTALKTVNYKDIEIEGNEVRLKNPDAMIDLGGIAKGYLADKMKEYLLKNGVESALINLGGNVLAVGEKPDGSAYNIGVQKPFYDGEVSLALSVKNKSIVSSGVYERYFELDGRIYHHILNTKDGYPYQNGLYGVTILSDESIAGDALSTTVFAMGLDEGMKFVEKLDGVEAIFIDEDYNLYSTDENLL